MFYTIYKITNKLDGKIYIGKHQTQDLDDGYMGSGKHLNHAIQKYGIENFEKEILHVFDNEDEMNVKEAELVTEEFVKEDTNYNLCPGGQGGWGYINSTRDHTKNSIKAAAARDYRDPSFLDKLSKASKKAHKEGKMNYSGWIGKSSGTTGYKFSEESKLKMSKAQIGEKNSQYGTIWITDGNKNRKIKKDELIPEGWNRGRK